MSVSSEAPNVAEESDTELVSQEIPRDPVDAKMIAKPEADFDDATHISVDPEYCTTNTIEEEDQSQHDVFHHSG